MRLILIIFLLITSCSSDEQQAETVQTKLTFSVEGMHCDSCVQAITNAVTNLDGIVTCDVSLEKEQAIIVVQEPLTEATVLETIRSLQFTVEPIAE